MDERPDSVRENDRIQPVASMADGAVDEAADLIYEIRFGVEAADWASDDRPTRVEHDDGWKLKTFPAGSKRSKDVARSVAEHGPSKSVSSRKAR